MTINIQFYNDNAQKLVQQYNSLSFEQVHPIVLKLLPTSGSVLDVGCGSGRDASALANLGFSVTAVDPSHKMLESASLLHNQVNWVQDQLPNLNSVIALQQTFDFILLSAVWMHIELEDRENAFKTLSTLLSKNGKMVIYLRHGKFTDERKELPVSFNELYSLALKFGLTATLLDGQSDDVLNRNEVSWQQVLIS